MNIYDEIIKILKEKLDFFNELNNLIENNGTGYEINYELERFKDHIEEKEKMFKDLIWQQHETDMDELYAAGRDKEVDEILDEVSKLRKYFLIAYPSSTRFIKVGNEKILSLKNKGYDYKRIMETIEECKVSALKNMGYVEFLKQKPKPSGRREVISYEKDLNEFIVFLDKKFEEWEQEKDRNKIN